MNTEEKSARVIVPDYQLSLAIGREGQNARLAARLTGYKIDIKSESQAGTYYEEEWADNGQYADEYAEEYADEWVEDGEYAEEWTEDGEYAEEWEDEAYEEYQEEYQE